MRESRREKGQRRAENEMEICVPQAPSLNPFSEEFHSRVKDNLQLKDASLAWPKPQLWEGNSIVITVRQVKHNTNSKGRAEISSHIRAHFSQFQMDSQWGTQNI